VVRMEAPRGKPLNGGGVHDGDDTLRRSSPWGRH
jgi:hypothetical protein